MSSFEISVPDVSITNLRQKLELARFPDELEHAGWDYGVPLSDIRRLVARWKDGYDWRKHESALNDELPQFTRDIDIEGFGSLNVHYVHKESEVKTAIPLLFIHGWPGSFLEARKILPLLISGTPSFHVVAVGQPGYGFSEAPHKKGFNIPQYAELCHKLMVSLGYTEYVTQAGDWGHAVARVISSIYGPRHAKAWHTNVLVGSPPESGSPETYTEAEKAGLDRWKWFTEKGTGYMHEHNTQPQTIGYSLADSPVGLLAWIYEKLVNWTDAYPWDDDEVLTWISIFWFSRAGPAASIRNYYENHNAGGSPRLKEKYPTEIPLGYSRFPRDLAVHPRSWIKEKNLIFESDHDSGGHFAAHEKPEELVEDLRKMFGKNGPAFGVVPGKNGY
ncbi:alpha/beta-hydrolase [Marasmius fiardii PR-910]|nr:alpha/beta-hydrolase [Marasmius fiardii PR-910]